MACAGILALIARYLRLAGFAAIVGVVASWPTGLALAAATLVFRYGNHGGLRKYSAVWRTVTPIRRRMEYLRDLAIGGGAAKEIRVFGITPWLTERYSEAYLGMIGPVTRMRRRIYLWPYLIYTSLGFVVSAFVAAGIARDAASGQISLTGLALGLQSVVGAILLGEYYTEADVPTQYGMQAVTALEEVRGRVAAAHEADRSADRPVAPDLPHQSLRFENISFSYPGSDQRVLDGLTLELPAGLTTAIVGVNGAGKTTLVKLLCRFYEATDGVIELDGTDLRRFPLKARRARIAAGFQDFVRFELLARETVGVGHLPDIESTSAVTAALTRARAEDLLSRLDDGLETQLGKSYADGTELSGGQWQMLALGRAMMRETPLLLVLDEPTSALDAQAEHLLFEQYALSAKRVANHTGAITVLVSHRFSTVRIADLILVVADGKVAESGSHVELMHLGGLYAELYAMQAAAYR